MKCKQCGADIIRIDTSNGKMLCNAAPVAYRRYGQPNTSVLTPNGETVYCRIVRRTEKAHGIGNTLHTCFQPSMAGRGSAGTGQGQTTHHDCLACSNAFSEPAERDGDPDHLFCMERQAYVSEDDFCDQIN